MDKVRKNSWLVRAAALAIFLLGFAAGAFAPSVYRAWMRDRSQGGGGGRIEQMTKNLNLSPEQEAQVRQIFTESRTQLEALRKESEPRFAELRRQADERLQKVMTPEQWQQFQQSRREGRPRGRRGRGGDDGPQSRPER
ncbi:MAG TPA: periplasmic heavy metal sensor [Pyrinomonadaceae bacterium]|jgi:Spy/CpxP family protein refolding chaperone